MSEPDCSQQEYAESQYDHDYRQLQADNERLREEANHWKDAYAEDVTKLDGEVVRLRGLLWNRVYEADGDADLYPCVLCGYNGQGFYQPDQHACAALGTQADQPKERANKVARTSA